MLDMDLEAFNDLVSVFHGVQALENLDRLSFLRIAVHGEKKDVQDLHKSLKKRAQGLLPVKDGEAFEAALKGLR